MEAERCQPAGPGHALDGWRPPHTRPDKGPAWRAIDGLSRPHAQPGVYARLHEEGAMRIGAEAPIPRQHIPRPQARMGRWHLGQVVGEAGRDRPRQEPARAGMKQPQQARHGEAAPGPPDRGLAPGLLSSRGLRPGAPRALHETRAMAMPLAFVRETGLQGAAAALQEEGQGAERASGAGVTGGRRTEASARQMRQMTAGGMAVQPLEEKERDGGDGRESTVAPGGLAGRRTRAKDGLWRPLGRPRGVESAQPGGATGDPRPTSCPRGDHRPLPTGETLVDQHRSHPYKLTTSP